MIQTLRNYEKLYYRLQGITSELATLNELIDAIGRCDGQPRGNQISRPTEDKAIKLCDKRAELMREQEKVLQAMNSIEALCKLISDERARLIIAERYFRFNNFESIGRKCKITGRQARRIHDESIEKLKSYRESGREKARRKGRF